MKSIRIIKIIKVYSLLLLIVSNIALSSCHKKKGLPSNTALLSKTWRVKSVTIDGVLDTDTDYSGYSFTFKGDNAYSFMAPDQQTGIWAFNVDESKIVLDGSEELSIIKLTATELELEKTVEATFKSPAKLAVFVLE